MSWTFYADGVDTLYTEAGISWRNVIGSPLVSAVVIADYAAGAAQILPGVFRVTFLDIDSVVLSAVISGDLKSPLITGNPVTVVADGITANTSVFPGLSLVFSASAIEGDIFELAFGCYWVSNPGYWQRVLPLDFVISGFDSPDRVLYVKNTSGVAQANCTLLATNHIRIVNGQSSSRPFYSFRQVGLLNPVADLDLLGQAITFTDFLAGTPNTVSILIDGSSVGVWDVANEILIADGSGLSCDSTTVYRFGDSTSYRSGEFILSSSLAGSDTATIFVSDGGDFMQIASETSAFTSGSNGITLTDAEAVEGVVDVDSIATFRVKLNAPVGKDGTLNQRLVSLRVYSEGI